MNDPKELRQLHDRLDDAIERGEISDSEAREIYRDQKDSQFYEDNQ